MHYFNDASTASTATNPLINELDKAVKEARSNEKWRHDYMTWQMYGQEKREEGLEEGLGALVQALFQFTTDFEKIYESVRTTSAYTNATIEQVRKFYEPLIAQTTLHTQSR